MDSKIKLILVGLGVLVLVVILAYLGFIPGRRAPQPPAAQIDFWGMEEENYWQDTIGKFSEKFPNISVKYRQISPLNYEETLLNALAEVKGPDIFVVRNTWIPKHKDKMYPYPRQIFNFTAADYKKNFVDIANDELVTPAGEILGLPLSVDTPVLVYNKDIFNSTGIAEIPRTWEDILEILPRVTRKSQSGEITTAGLAFGTSNNVNNFFEIISSLVLQFGDKIIVPRTGEFSLGAGAERAIGFYASFADSGNPNYAWNSRLGESLEAFTQEKAAMAIVFAKELSSLNVKNPHLNFDVLPLPQPRSIQVPVMYGSYEVPVVSKFTQAPQAAWQFLTFAALQDGTEPYLQASGLPPARRNIIAAGANSSVMQIFYRQALLAKGWPVPDEKATKNIFLEAISGVNNHTLTPQQAIGQILNQLSILQF